MQVTHDTLGDLAAQIIRAAFTRRDTLKASVELFNWETFTHIQITQFGYVTVQFGDEGIHVSAEDINAEERA